MKRIAFFIFLTLISVACEESLTETDQNFIHKKSVLSQVPTQVYTDLMNELLAARVAELSDSYTITEISEQKWGWDEGNLYFVFSFKTLLGIEERELHVFYKDVNNEITMMAPCDQLNCGQQGETCPTHCEIWEETSAWHCFCAEHIPNHMGCKWDYFPEDWTPNLVSIGESLLGSISVAERYYSSAEISN